MSKLNLWFARMILSTRTPPRCVSEILQFKSVGKYYDFTLSKCILHLEYCLTARLVTRVTMDQSLVTSYSDSRPKRNINKKRHFLKTYTFSFWTSITWSSWGSLKRRKNNLLKGFWKNIKIEDCNRNVIVCSLKLLQAMKLNMTHR